MPKTPKDIPKTSRQVSKEESKKIFNDIVETSGLSHREFRKISGVQQSVFSRYINGKTSISYDYLISIIKSVGLEIKINLKKKV